MLYWAGDQGYAVHHRSVVHFDLGPRGGPAFGRSRRHGASPRGPGADRSAAIASGVRRIGREDVGAVRLPSGVRRIGARTSARCGCRPPVGRIGREGTSRRCASGRPRARPAPAQDVEAVRLPSGGGSGAREVEGLREWPAAGAARARARARARAGLPERHARPARDRSGRAARGVAGRPSAAGRLADRRGGRGVPGADVRRARP
jgi:hypothetical protein